MVIPLDNQFDIVPASEKKARALASLAWSLGISGSCGVLAQHWGLDLAGPPLLLGTYAGLALHAGAMAKFYGHLKTGFPAEPVRSIRFRACFTPFVRGMMLPVSMLRGLATDHPGMFTDAIYQWFGHRHGLPTRPGDFQSPVGDANTRAGMTFLASSAIGTLWMPHFLATQDPLQISVALAAAVAAPTITGALVTASYFDELAAIPADPEARACYMRHSPDQTEANSTYEGDNLTNGSTQLLAISAHGENAFTTGTPGSGKTAGEERKIAQIITFPKGSMVIADMKGDDMALASAALESAKRAGIKLEVKYFTTTDGWPSHTFNLFEQDWFQRMPPYQKGLYLGQVLGTTHDLTVYGEGWYTGGALKLYVTTFERYESRSLEEYAGSLYRIATNPRQAGITKDIARAGMQAWLDVDRLAKIPPLNVIGNPKGIQLSEMHTKKQLLILRLPSIELHQMTGTIYRMFSIGKIKAGMGIDREHPILSAGDEAIRAMGGCLDFCLDQGRSMNVAFSLTAHSWDRLRPEHRAVVESTTRIHREYDVSNKLRQKMLSETSGQEIIWLQSRKKHWMMSRTTSSGSAGSTTRTFPTSVTDVTENQTIVNRLPINDIAAASAHPKCSFLTLTRDEDGVRLRGETQIIKWDFFVSKQEHERRKKAPWVEHNPSDGMIIVGESDDKPNQEGGGMPAEPTPPAPQGSPVTRQTIQPHQPRPRKKSRRYNPLHPSLNPQPEA